MRHFKHVFRSMRFHIIILYTLLILGAITVLSSVSYRMSYSMAKRQKMEEIGLLTSQIADSLNVYFEDAVNAMNFFRSDITLWEDIRECNRKSQAERYEHVRNIQRKMKQAILNDNDIHNIIIISDNFQFNCQDSGIGNVNYGSDLIREIVSRCDEMKKYNMEFMSAKNKDYVYGGSGKEEMLVCFPIKDADGSRTLATMIYVLNFDRIDKICKRQQLWEQYGCYLIDGKGKLFYAPSSTFPCPEYDWSPESATNEIDNMMLLSFAKIEANNWRVAYQIDLSEIRKQLETIRHFTVITSIIAIFLVIIISVYIGWKCTRSVRTLSDSMKKFGEGEFYIQVDENSGYEEIDILNKNFNHMAQQIDNLINEVYAIRVSKQQAELEALQSKINPHFLNNTLQSITSLAILGRNQEIIFAIDSLRGMFDYILYEMSDMVPVSKELEYIERYIEIQNIRFNHGIEWKRDIPELMLPYRVPKLILQPVVENSIRHGLKEKKGAKKLLIQGEVIEGRICFTITDNGVGIGAQRLGQLEERLAEGQETPGHIGLTNVHSRLKLNYDSGSGIRIRSLEGRYCSVRLCMGLEEKEYGA